MVERLTYFIQTFGCQMNEQDSLRMGALLEAAGHRRVLSPEEADVLVVNTCSIRRKAEEKACSLLGRLRRFKEKRPDAVLVVAGCVSQRLGEDLLDRISHLDLVLGPHHVSEIAVLAARCRERRERIVATSMRESTAEDLECPGVVAQGGSRAYVTIMEGCNNFCSFCIVPYVRGRERSRPVASLVLEVTRLVAEKGVGEIVLLGQNVNAYRAPDRPRTHFPELLARISEVPGLRRLRFTTSHPKDLSDGLIRCFGKIGVLCEHLHVPLQAGSDRVLGAMNRGYTAETYLARIASLRERAPEIAVSSDMIVGFPGEGAEDFDQTLEMVRRVRFDSLYSFRYSCRPGTRAAGMPGQVPIEEKARRLALLQELQRGISLERNRELEGAALEVLVEGRSRDGARWMGRTRTNKVVNFSAPDAETGELVVVLIRKGLPNCLLGEAERGPGRARVGASG